MKKCTACAFSSTRKDRRPKKWTIPPMACSIDCHAVGGGGSGLAASKGAPVHTGTGHHIPRIQLHFLHMPLSSQSQSLVPIVSAAQLLTA